MPPRIEVVLQALRIGDLAIATLPFELFVEIGLEIKAKSDAYTVQTHDGRTLFGRMVHRVLRADVASMAAGAGSLKPGGFDQG